MRCNHLPGDYNGGPSLTEWLAQIWKAVKSIVENGVKNPHKLTFTGDVEAEYDGSKDVTVDISGGGGGGGESDKLWYPYIVEKVLNWRKTTSTTTPTPFDLNQLKGDTGPAGPYTDIEIGRVTTGEPGTNAEATFDTSTPGVARLDLKIPRGNPGTDGTDGSTGPAGHDGAPGAAAGFGTVDATATTGTTAAASVTTDGPDTAKNMHFAFTIPTGGGGGGGGDTPIVYNISSATLTGESLSSQSVNAQVVQIGKQLIIRGYLSVIATSTVAAVTAIDLKFSSRVPSLPSVSSNLRFNNAGFYVSESKVSNTFELTIDKFGNEYLLTFKRGSNYLNLTSSKNVEQGFFYMVVFLE